MSQGPSKRYDEAYFNRWYRDPQTRVITPGDVQRKARLALGAAEYLLGRPVKRVLDIGAGEGSWRGALRALRPRVQYVGIDPSEYAVRRFGARRGIRLGSFDRLDEAGLRGSFDLIVCVGVMNYLGTAELRRGLHSIASMLDGVAFLEIWTTDDDIIGDRRGWHHHPASYYRRLMKDAGLAACGLHCYASPAIAHNVAALEALR